MKSIFWLPFLEKMTSNSELQFKDEDASKQVFLCCRLKDVPDEERTTSSVSKVLKIFQDTLKKESVEPLINELKLKVDRFKRYQCQSLSIPSVDENFLDPENSSNADEVQEYVELLTFAEVLTDTGYKLPKALQRKRDEILAHKRIPAKPTRGHNEPVNSFFVYTLNKTLAEICDSLSAEEVFKLKTFIINHSKETAENAKKNGESMTMAEETEKEMAQAVSVIESVTKLQAKPFLKDAAFYYMIVFMFKGVLLNSVYTEKLEEYLEGAKSLLPNDEKPGPVASIPRALIQLKKYQLASRPPGLCLILAMEEHRPGNKKDVSAVKNFFESELHYDIIYKENPSVNDVRATITKVGESRNKFYDSLVVWVMAHGDEAYLTVGDGEIHRRRDLIQPLVTIGWLEAKPKLFFIQSCAEKRRKSSYEDRGRKHEKDSLPIKEDEFQKRSMYEANTSYTNVNVYADTLVCYSTMWYQQAAREDNDGSLFIDVILKVLKKKGREVSIENVLRETTLKMNSVVLRDQDSELQWRQTPYYESSLQKKFIFPKKRE